MKVIKFINKRFFLLSFFLFSNSEYKTIKVTRESILINIENYLTKFNKDNPIDSFEYVYLAKGGDIYSRIVNDNKIDSLLKIHMINSKKKDKFIIYIYSNKKIKSQNLIFELK